MTVAWVFPGQGSQKIGMAKQIESLPNTKDRFSYAMLLKYLVEIYWIFVS